MQRILVSSLIVLFSSTIVFSTKVEPTKNVIVMIPDGTSLSVLSASRWLKTYRNEGTKLAVDPYLCGTVTTFCSNAPIGDSAPTTSCYMTGIAQKAGNVSIYPVADPKNDLVKLNPDSAYQPLATILEAMKIEQKKAAGLVVTCEFPHATPADCSSHTYSRKKYDIIAPQMAFNNLEVVIGGGNDFITEQMKQHFKNNGTTLVQNSKEALLSFTGNKIWAIYDNKDIPYDIDRDTTKIPSLAQATSKAIEVLEKNKNGFFLMVEGSKIDWAAHANDPVAIMSEYLAFDKAVAVVMDYARKMGNTTVVILPDHGNSGFSIGRKDLPNYSGASLEKLFGTASKIKHTAIGIEEKLKTVLPNEIKSTFKALTSIELTDDEVIGFQKVKSAKNSDYTEAGEGESLTNLITKTINSRMFFGFTTNGHTGEEVFLGAYHPKGHIPTGNLRNNEINSYLFEVAGLKKPLQTLTFEIYARHTDVFKGMNMSISKKGETPELIVKNGSKTLIIPAYSSIVSINGNNQSIGSVTVYVDKTDTFYLSAKLKDLMK